MFFQKIAFVEKSIGSIVGKLDRIIIKFDAMEKNKARRREAMTKILEGVHEDGSVDGVNASAEGPVGRAPVRSATGPARASSR